VVKNNGDAGALKRIREGARSIQAMDNDGVTRSALESSERGDQDFGAPDLEGVEYVMDDEACHGFADLNKSGDRRGVVWGETSNKR
jgi:hypothetical protein